ncbi:2-succinyl-5-enolpyruvyl-6-hydroxy-3-cyclohexene-1-carboxylate synthase [Flexibacter flexilis DSM 6793]|uniref:2-succinyl-5-enolpyruvyl-6-hydroxy-3-cyclohexene-1-carboxylate synthase n=2 Tax=Flexibacter flexilis TaxID=998 RepID=A0A1I1EJ52_9BACT|nr:2-succinyl-5-enolpyruvyl-6-hydroxy-3-cyclohexene-1-carboxylate synthase [Flexibacter flexilis DSM 6793]
MFVLLLHNMILQPLVDIAAICAAKNVTEFVVSSGSRCAPLTLALVRHTAIRTRTISDERAAAFVALGMAQMSGNVVGLVCTSGSAVLNYAPAISEAFYQQIPLLVITADRPPEWIEQQDGQTIQQQEVYGKHVKASYQLPADYTHPDAVQFINRVLNEAINLAQVYPCGPVHVNVPIREPFYPEENEIMQFDAQPRVIEEISHSASLPRPAYMNLANEWLTFSRKMLVVGQVTPDLELRNALYACCLYNQMPLVADLISNMHQAENAIDAHDLFLMTTDEQTKKDLQPDLLVTVGNSVLSKNLKTFLRKYKPKQHWHVQKAGKVADPFGTLTRIIRTEPAEFFTKLGEQGYFEFMNQQPNAFAEAWLAQQQNARERFVDFFKNTAHFTEFGALRHVMQALPDDSHLHLANSMSVRYANFLSLEKNKKIGVWSNRGTSGIDGCTATAVGAALQTEKIVTLITGDVAFFYDRNGLWHNYLPNNLRIVLINNRGGAIFKMIDGPARQPEADEYFQTRQQLTAERTCADAQILYHKAENDAELKAVLETFFAASEQAKLLEISSYTEVNAAFFREMKKQFV